MTPGSSRRQFVQSLYSIPLIARGRPLPAIVLAREASASEHWAAEQLRRYIEQMTGARLEITDTASAGAAIALGESAVTERLGLKVPTGEACLLRTVGDTLIIAGGRERGTMYGVFEFLERLGCRWYTPDVARIPKRRGLRIPQLPIPQINETIRPAFDYREIFFTEAQGKEWSARNRLNGNFHHLDESTGGKISYFPFAHSFYELVPPDRWFGAHPAYFALVAGKRRAENAQLCLTNDDVVRIATERVGEWIAAHPEVSVFSVSQNDGGGWCECDACRAIVASEGAQSGVLLRFVNRVAEPFAHSHPKIAIDTLAYQATIDPPKITRPRSNVQIRFCPIDACQGHPWTESRTSCDRNRNTQERFAAWSRIAPGLRVWHYSINFAHYLLPFPNEHELVADIPRFRRAGAGGVFVEGSGSDNALGGENAALRSWIAARLLWNPEVDIGREIHGFFDAVYGPTARARAQYFELRHREIARGEHLFVDQGVDAPYLSNRFLHDARSLFSNDLSLEYIDAMRERRCALRNTSYGPADPERLKSDTHRFIDEAKSERVTELREGFPITDQARNFDQLGVAFPVITLRAGGAVANIVPALGARVIAFTPSANGKNLLPAPDPGAFAYPYTGGLFVSVAASYFSQPQQIAWQLADANEDAAVFTGKSEPGIELRLEYRIENGALHVTAEAVNTSASPLDAALKIQSNNETRWSPEATLAPGEKLTLNYALKDT